MRPAGLSGERLLWNRGREGGAGGGTPVSCFLILAGSSPLHHTSTHTPTVPPAPSGSQSRAAPLCDALSPNDSPSPGSLHLAAAGSFWLAVVVWGGQTQRPLPSNGLPGLHLHRSPRSMGMCEHPRWVPTVAQPPAVMGTGRASQQTIPLPRPVSLPFPAPRDFPRRRVQVPITQGAGTHPLWLPPLRLPGWSHQSSCWRLSPLDTGTGAGSSQRGKSGPGVSGHTPLQLRAPPNPARGTKGRRRWLTFGGSPLFGLQR